MRGKAISNFANGMNTGITPAYAGKRRMILLKKIILGDHPRLCGEKWKGCNNTKRKNRITPAYAGKSRQSWGR